MRGLDEEMIPGNHPELISCARMLSPGHQVLLRNLNVPNSTKNRERTFQWRLSLMLVSLTHGKISAYLATTLR